MIRTATMLNKLPWMHFMIHCIIFFLVAPSIPSEASTTPLTSSQKQKQSNEIMALLAFTHNSIAGDPNGFLDDWSPASLSPCSWVGVSCSPTGQVSALNFSYAGLIGRLQIDDLMVLENLQHLYLSGNSFSGNLLHKNGSYPCIIETLDLSFNNLSEPISKSFVDSCDRLTSLNLSHNMFSGDITAPLDSELPGSLEFFDISHNNLSGNFSMLEFKNCAKLLVLNLSNNVLYGTGIPTSLSNCRLLQNLDLSHNELQGKIPAALGNLKYLNLAHNDLSGSIPLELGWTCRTLVKLDLSGNRLSVQLQVPFNNITGSIPPSLGNVTKLQVLNLSSNALSGNIPSRLCFSSTSLKKLLLAGNFLSGPVPSDIGNCKNLRTIDFSLNNLSGSIPPDVWMLPHLSDLIMRGNNFLLSGEIPASIGTLQKLGILQLNHNSFTGRIPPELGSCQSLIWLDLNNNHFTGSIPSELANQTGRAFKNHREWNYVYVRSEGKNGCNVVNNLLYSEGIRPERLADSFGLMSYLQVLNLEHNRLTGTIPEALGSLGVLGVLDLSHNQLEGDIAASLELLSFLSDMDVSNNNLSGITFDRSVFNISTIQI
ncbi:hypothetical protein REPUB_Repub11eG0035300 [Reevesia pubescens]